MVATSTLCNKPIAESFTEVWTSSITARWSENSNPGWTEYLVECSSLSIGGEVFASSETLNTYAIFSFLDVNTTYYFRVKADADWETLGSTSTLCNKPAGQPFTDVNVSSMTAKWSANGNSPATKYFVECSSISAGGDVLTSSITLNNYADFSSLDINTTYYFRVRAKNNNEITTA